MNAVKRMVVVVLGMHRSGTSAIARSLETLGVGLGDNLHPAGFDNPKGFWEDRECLDINNALLQHLGSAYDRLAIAWPEIESDAVVSELKLRAVRTVAGKLQSCGGIWGFKDPRTCRLVRFWSDVFAALDCEVRYVIALRNPLEVAASLAERNKLPAEKSYYLWLQHTLGAVAMTAGQARVLVSYELLLQEPVGQLTRIASKLGLREIDREDPSVRSYTEDFLDAGLRHASYGDGAIALDVRVPRDAASLYELLRDAARDRVSLDSPEVLTSISALEQKVKGNAPAFSYINALEDERADLWRSLSELDANRSALSDELSHARVELEAVRAASEDREVQNAALSQRLGEHDSRLSALTQAVAERDARATVLVQGLSELESQITSLSKEMTGRDTKIVGLTQEVVESEARVAELAEALSVRECKLAAVSKELAERDEKVAILTQEIVECQAKVAELAQILSERDSQITGLSESVYERDSRVRDLNDAVVKHGTENGELGRALGERDGQISGLMQAVAERDARIDGLSRAIAECELQIAQMALANEALHGQVDALHSSTSWRITEPMRFVSRRLKGAVRVAALARGPRLVSTTHVGDGSAGRGFASASTAAVPLSLPAKFDREIYLELNPDVRQCGMDPVTHFVKHGRFEGRSFCRPELTILSSKPRDAAKASVLVVSHDASRTGAPILSLNLVESLAERYNVVVLLLGPGVLETAFQSAATEVLIDPVIRRTPQLARYVIEQICDRHELLFALVNSIESRVVLRALASRFVPSVSLLHEFASYTRPRHAFRDAFLWSAETVFSARVTKENALGEYPDLSEFSVEVVPQGRCNVPREAVAPELVEAERTFIGRKMRPPGQAADAVVILGAGSVQLRKGVELFLECASRVAKAPGGEKCRFVWIGHGYNPDDDIAYSVYLADQIRRAGLEQRVVFVRETSEIEVAYESADIFLLSSRLDPLPNVAIDAMNYGLPVVCFDKTTGIADFLLESGLGDACVAEYLDSYEMARKILALAASPAFRSEIGERCREASLASFRMQDYVSRLEALALSARERMNQERADGAVILGCDRFLPEFAAPAQQREMPREGVVGQYVRSWASGIDRRKPYPGFHPGIYREQGRVALGGADPFAAYLQAGQPSGPWSYPVISGPAPTRRSTGKAGRVALHIHAYFADLIPELLARLEQNEIRPDLFVSVRDEESRKVVAAALARYKGKVVDVRAVPNRGRDIGPFLTAFGERLATRYDLVGHLHTKKSLDIKDSGTGSAWYSFLLENLLGGQVGGSMADQIIARMSDDSGIGIVFPDDPYVVGWSNNLAFAEPLAKRLGVPSIPADFNFPVGTMFWARASVLASFVGLGLSWDDYPEEPLPYDGSLLHAVERLFGLVPAAQGLHFAVTHVPGVTR